MPRASSPEGLFAAGLADISFAALRRVTREFAGAVFGGARGARDALGVAVAEVGIAKRGLASNAEKIKVNECDPVVVLILATKPGARAVLIRTTEANLGVERGA